MKILKIIALIFAALILVGGSWFVQSNWIYLQPDCQSPSTPVFGYEIVNSYPHNEKSFTEGFVLENGIIYESTGWYGWSSIQKLELATGKLLQHILLDKTHFGEGLTRLEDRLFQLTFQEKKALLYDKKGFRLTSEVPYSRDGWGLTHDNQYLIASDGLPYLYFLDKENFSTLREVPVTDGECSVYRLNELEYVKGEIYANLFGKDRIARISPESGKVLSWIDISGLRPTNVSNPKDRIPNGIAYDPLGDRLFVTGKLWPKIYEIKLIEKK